MNLELPCLFLGASLVKSTAHSVEFLSMAAVGMIPTSHGASPSHRFFISGQSSFFASAPLRRWPLAGGAGDPYNAEEVELGRDSLLFSSEASLAFDGPIGGGSYSRARKRHSTAAVRIVMDALASHAGAKT